VRSSRARWTAVRRELRPLILDDQSRSDTYPTMEIEEKRVTIGTKATVSKIGDEQLFYLTSRGIPPEEARR